MPFKFRHLCDLLQSLDDNRLRKRLTSERAKNSDIPIIVSWFNKHERLIPRNGTAAVAFLSCLFPERRADRVYNVQEKRLEKIVGRSLFLSTTRLIHLSSWRTQNGADFAQTVQNVMSQAENPRPRPEHEVTLEEIDAVFDQIAATYGGSSPELRMRILDPLAASDALQPLLLRLQSIEAKWLIRMFLKRYTPIELPERLVMGQFHCLLPDILCLQNCFTAATKCLDEPALSHICPRPRNTEHEQAIKLEAAPHLKPHVGVMIQRSSYQKARSIKHCCDMATRRRISVERKYDGEYCQIHIDTSNDRRSIKLFSKSGKDSTDDRIRLHGAIENALKLGEKDCPIKRQCILEGELLIWHDKEHRILPFEKIRKHVTRNGRFLGNDQDSPRDLHEKVMIMFYDLLLYDDIVCMNESLEQRRSRLRSLVRRIPGQAELGHREKINFASSDAKSLICLAFAKCISKGWEGFVLKGCDDPYFSLAGSPPCIKLKKDYITGLGDMADLAIIGGRRDARDEQALNVGKLNWTTFHLGCLENRAEVHRFSAKPRFRLVGVVSAAKGTLSLDRTRLLSELGQFERIPYASNRAEMDVVMDLKILPPTELFKNPFVVEVVGGGFEKPANVTYHSLRFPRITKIHEDRPWHDTMTFDELQELASKAQAMADNEDSQEDCEWIEKLMQADPRSKYVTENSGGTSTGRNPGSVTTASATPFACRPSTSPILVRIDTQELEENAHHDGTGMLGGARPSPVWPTKKTNSSKRKQTFDAHNPVANMSTKRLRLSLPQADFNVKDVSSGYLPACGSQLRRPLQEIPNPSSDARTQLRVLQPSEQSLSNQRQHDSIRLCSRPSKEKSSPATAMLQSKVTVASAANQAVIKMPKPSATLAQEGQEGDSQPVSPQQHKELHTALRTEAGEPHYTVMTHSRTSPMAYKRSKSSASIGIELGFSSMILLSTSVPTRLPTDRHDLPISLANVKASFTFSHEVFFNDMERADATSHVAIVDIRDPDGTGKEVGYFHRSISEQLRDGRITGDGRLFFFDWTVLHLLSLNESSPDQLKQYFGGCLIWKSNADAVGKRTWEIRDIWRWSEVLNPVDLI